MSGRAVRATLLALMLLAVAAPQASALTRQVLAPVNTVVEPVVSTVSSTLGDVTRTVSPDLNRDLRCAQGAMPGDLRVVAGAPVFGGCTALFVTCGPVTPLHRVCEGAIGPLRLRCEETQSSWSPGVTVACSQAVGDGSLGLTRSCVARSSQSGRSGTFSSEECVVTANAAGASVALTCDRLYSANSFTGAVEDEGCASGPLSVRCRYASAVDELRETCAARLETETGAAECRLVFHRDGGTPAEPGRIRNVDAERSGCGAA